MPQTLILTTAKMIARMMALVRMVTRNENGDAIEDGDDNDADGDDDDDEDDDNGFH